MSRTSAVILVLATLLGVGTACAREGRKPWPKPTPPPPPSPIFMQSSEPTMNEEQIERLAQTHNQRLEHEIEVALAGRDRQRREAVFTFLLPELVQVDPQRVVAMVADLGPGELRDTLRTEVTLQWIAKDPPAAVEWMKTLSERERRASATTAIASMLPYAQDQARALADTFGVNLRCAAVPAGSRDDEAEPVCRL